MKKHALTALIAGLIVSTTSIAAPQQEYQDEMDLMFQQMRARVLELREYASDDGNVILENGKRYIMVDGRRFEIDAMNYLNFDLPFPYHNEDAIRHVFSFFDNDWLLMEYGRGVNAVHRLYGNYEAPVGQGCQLAYQPYSTGAHFDPKSVFVKETESCALEENESHEQLAYLGKAQKLDFATFGYESESDFAPESVAVSNGKVYVGNTHSGFSHIVRYDLKTQQALAPITGFTFNGTQESYRVVSDVTEHNGRLYVASLSSNRVDIYDTRDDSIIMSLGTGQWGGNTFDKNLTHPSAVAANNDYVFVADITGKISVYLQSDVTTENHKRTTKHAFLSLPDSNSIWSNVKLEVVGNELIASFDNSKTYVFDITHIEASDVLVDAEKVFNRTSRRNVYESANGDIFVGTSQGQIEQFSAGSLEFGENGVVSPTVHEFRTYLNAQTNAEESTSASFDLAVENDTLAMLQGRTVLLSEINKLDVYVDKYPSWEQPVDFDLYAPEVVKTPLLFDGESWESLTQNHSVRVDRLLSGKQHLDGLEIISYVAQRTQDLTVEARIGKNTPWIKLGSLVDLDPFSSFKLDHTFEDSYNYPTVSGEQSVVVMGFNELDYLPKDLIDIRLTSKTDEFVKKITDFKSKWRLHFGTYGSGENPGNWGMITPPYAREWMIIMANYAYVMNSPEFEHLWFNYKASIGQGQEEFFGNAGPIDGPGGNFTPADYERYYQAFMDRSSLRLGVSTIGGGLGGGNVLGIDTWFYYAHYYNSGIGVVGHEFGHHWGSHDSSFANEARGLQRMTHDIHQMMIRQQNLPYLDDEINAFYKSPQDQLHNSVAEHLRKPRPVDNVNVVERYFQENALPLKL
ncbi:hypothetical protein LRP50_06820 [Enterovibrio sp. ZSDZ42]|uniref:Beta-propeller fold lactonase family protein n=1 Tax=Enterovibrio gelatinilyticus TaxID=2899819 RepID=A0ABT5QXW5_9GAMM|nr:hypothetical protein [Enterovibrio sp. ZSDZ42]MDD1792834.1 hypothetical protein [Enterovibrio sp. ZSDZ42]